MKEIFSQYLKKCNDQMVWIGILNETEKVALKKQDELRDE